MDTESDLPGLIYAWDFGDSKSASEPFVEHSYPDEGVYEVILTVTDDDGDSDTARVKVTVLNSIPTCVAMDDIEIFEDELVQFSGSGSDTDNDKSLLQYSWYLGVPMVPATPWSDTAVMTIALPPVIPWKFLLRM